MRRLVVVIFILLSIVIKEASAAKKIADWTANATKVCAPLSKAAELYRQEKIKEAYTEAVMAYFKGYDQLLEPGVRITLGAKHVFAIEQQFHALSRAIRDKKQTPDKIQEQSNNLCKLIHDDAKALIAEQVPEQVFTVGP